MCQKKPKPESKRNRTLSSKSQRIITIYMHIQVLLRMVMSFDTADFSPKSVCSQCGGTHTDSPTTNQLLIPPLSSLTLAGCSSENRKIEIENRKLREIATSHCCLQNRLILGKFICFPVKDIHIVRNRTGC